MFLVLRGYTAFAEAAEPEEFMGVLREYHAAMGQLINLIWPAALILAGIYMLYRALRPRQA